MLSLYRALSLDVKLLLLLVLIRRASFGLTNQVLALFLESAGITKAQIGIFMTLTLAGDTVISYFLTWFSDNIGRRLVMVIGCILMLFSGLVFAAASNFWILLVAAILGVILTSGDETGPFKTVEEACLSHLTPPKYRAHTFAIYGFLGMLGAAVGASVCGFTVDFWNLQYGWTLEKCYRAVFVMYAVLAFLKFAIALTLSKKCEISELVEFDGDTTELVGDSSEIDETDNTSNETPESRDLIAETTTLLDIQPKETSRTFQPFTRRILPRLLVVFMLDLFGYGFMPPAWIVYYFKTEFGVAASALGTLFFFTNLVDSFLSIVSAFTFSRLGPVKAILAAQVPSAIFFLCVPFCPTYLAGGLFYFLFCATGSMDVVPRQILLTTLIPKQDLLRVMGTVNIGKTFARCVGPLLTGKLAEHNLLYVGFLVNGFCLIVADTVLGLNFVHLDREVMEMHKA